MNNSDDKNLEIERFFKDTSPKLEDLKIKLYDYSYFHSTSKIQEQRRVDRSRLKKKLDSLINQSNSKCGAYLVTGYRGVGKSSLVQEVIEENRFRKESAFRLPPIILRIIFLIMLFQTFKILLPSINNSLISLISFALTLLFSFLLFWMIKFNSSDFRIKRKTDQKLKSLFHYVYNKISNRRHLQILSDLSIIFFSIAISYLFIAVFAPERYLLLLLIFALPVLIIGCIYYFEQLKDLKKSFKRLYTVNRKLFIHINFGHDELDESDIFRLIAYNLRDKLKKKYNSFKLKFFEFSYKFVISFFLFLILKNLNVDDKTNFYRSIEDLYKLIQPAPYESKLSSEVAKAKGYVFKATNTGDISIEINAKESPKNKNSFLYKLYTDAARSIDALYYGICSNLGFKNPLWMPDYILLLLLFSLVCILMRIINRKNYYKIILYSLDRLISHIEAQVRSTKSAGFDSSGFTTFFKKEKEYPLADVREIERRLIAILESMRKLPFLYQRYEVIFVFDELDKLEPRNNGADKIEKSEIATGVTPDNIRKRQNNVFKVLANMKYFLNTAKAKFIFLAGREMYDAALADVADRNSFLSSIFYDVIYVPSIFNIDFESNNKKQNSTIDFVEQFVCQQLMPYEGNNKDKEDTKCNLKSYNYFLISTFKELNRPRIYNPFFIKVYKSLKIILSYNKWSNFIVKGLIKQIINTRRSVVKREIIIAKQKREKIIFTLYHFIIYLTHLSNGSVKKMISLFENYIETAEKDDKFLFTEEELKENELYLRFDENAQHLFAMTNYLVGPMILKQDMLGNNMYSDKLLVQTSYLTDHILKFHRQPFTDGSLELIPEIIDPNRSPELRSLLNDVLSGYTRTHLEKISFNLPSYKFNRLIQQEISYLSKLNEQASAAFNFSLDESFAIKKHYIQLLENNQNSKSPDLKTCSAFSYILGELNFFDEQYDDAIQYYSKALARFNGNASIIDNNEIFFYLKLNLKLGLVFEKRNAYEAAFSYYQKAIETVRGQHFKFRDEIEFTKLSYQAILAKLYLIEKSTPTGISHDELEKAEYDFKTIMKGIDISKIYLFKSDFYYKLATLLYWKSNKNEKNRTQILKYLIKSIKTIGKGSACTHLKLLIEKEIDTKKKDIKPTSIEFLKPIFSKKREILKEYSLNLDEIKQLTKCISLYGHFLLGIEEGNVKYNELKLNEIREEEEFNPKYNIEIAIQLFYYAARLCKLNNDDKLFMWQLTKSIYIIKHVLLNNKKIEKNNEYNKLASNLLKDIIRGAHSMEDNIYKIEIARFKEIFSKPTQPNNKKLNDISLKRATVTVELEEALTLYSDIEMISNKEENNILKIFKNYNNTPYSLGTTSLNQILWLKNKFHLNYEIFNTYFFKQDKKIFFKPYRRFGHIDKLDMRQFTFTNFYNWFNYLFSNSSDRVFKKIKDQLNIIEKDEKGYKYTIFEQILFESLYCGVEIIRLYKSHGDNKLLSNLFMAKIHEYMILWTSIWYFYRDYNQNNNKDEVKIKFIWYTDTCLHYFNNNKNRDKKQCLVNYNSFCNYIENFSQSSASPLHTYIKNNESSLPNITNKPNAKIPNYEGLKKLLGKNNILLLDHVYYTEETRKLYHFLEDIPNERFIYKKELQNLYYLNDDFTDDRSHFFIANDRYELSKEQIRSKIDDLKYLFYSSRYYEPEKYFTTIPDRN